MILSPNNGEDIRDFLEKFNEILAKITRNDKYCYLGGDYNIDLFHYSDHAPTQEFVDSLFSHMFIPLINRPTRITAHSATLIDNIFTNNVRCKHFNGIVINDISDHLPVFVYEVDETEIASKNSLRSLRSLRSKMKYVSLKFAASTPSAK